MNWPILILCFADCWENLINRPESLWMYKLRPTIIWGRMNINHVRKSMNTATPHVALKHHIIWVTAHRDAGGFSCTVFRKAPQSSTRQWDKDPTLGPVLRKHEQFSLSKTINNESRRCIGASAINISSRCHIAYCRLKGGNTLQP